MSHNFGLLKECTTVDRPVSESEKLQTIGVGCRVSENVHHLPIKKRRFILRSPSPPPRATSLPPVESKTPTNNEVLAFNNDASMTDKDQLVDTGSGTNEKKMNKTPDGIGELSGISIRVAPACSNSSQGDEHTLEDPRVGESLVCVVSTNESSSLLKEDSKEDFPGSQKISTDQTGCCISSVPEEVLCPHIRENSSMDDLVNVNNLKSTSVQDHSCSGLHDSFLVKENTIQKTSSRDERLHWDLNTSIDAWECSFDKQSADCQTVVTDNASADVESGIVLKYHNNEAKTEPYSAEPGTKIELLFSNSADMNDEKQHSDTEQPTSGICAKTQNFAEKLACSGVVNFPGDDKAEIRTYNVLNGDTFDAKKLSQLHDDGDLMKEKVSLVTSPKEIRSYDSLPKEPSCELGESGLSLSYPAGIEAAQLGILDCNFPQLAVDLKAHIAKGADSGISRQAQNECKEQTTRSSENSTAFSIASAVCDSHGTCGSRSVGVVSCLDKIDIDQAMHDDSDASNNGNTSIKVSGYDIDYDSQYEDGEVRESIVHAWEDYDGEGLEYDPLDYESDYLGFDGEQLMRKSLGTPTKDVVQSRRKETGVVKICNTALDKLEAAVEKGSGDTNTGRSNIEPESQPSDSKMEFSLKLENLDTPAGIRDGSTRKSNEDRPDKANAEDMEPRISGFRALRNNLQSQEERKSLYLQGTRQSGNLNPNLVRNRGHIESFGNSRNSYDAYSRGQGADRLADYRNKSMHRSPKLPDSMSFHRTGSENDGRDSRISTNGMHRPLTRNLSPNERDESFNMRMGNRVGRELSPSRRSTYARGRSMRYVSRDGGRGPSERYFSPVLDDCVEPAFKRDRSFSPTDGRRVPDSHQSRPKSPLRSRARSPNSGSQSFRRRSISPIFRSEVGMQRTRSPSQRFDFRHDHSEGFRSVTRNNYGPQRDSKWHGDRKDEEIHFREQGYNHSQRNSFLERRSPERYSIRDDRFHYSDTRRSYRGKYSDMDGDGRQRQRYEGGRSDDDRGEDGFRYGSDHPPLRRSDVERADERDRHRRRSPWNYDRGMECRNRKF